ncbi:hypothetical protein V8E53_002272 [Lactarius tabidus]
MHASLIATLVLVISTVAPAFSAPLDSGDSLAVRELIILRPDEDSGVNPRDPEPKKKQPLHFPPIQGFF